MLDITNVTAEGKTREVPNEAYYFEEMLAKMDEIINGQESIRQMLAGMSAVTGMFGIAQASADVSKGINEISQSISEMSNTVQEYYKISATPVAQTVPVTVPKAEEVPKKETGTSQTAETPQTGKAKQAKRPHKFNAFKEALKLLMGTLTTEPTPVSDIEAIVRDAGISNTIFYRARKALVDEGKIICFRQGTPAVRYMRLLAPEETAKLPQTHIEVTSERVTEQNKNLILAQRPEEYESYKAYGDKAYQLAYEIVDLSPKGKYKTASSVYADVFRTMNAQYGFCWAQMGKEAKAAYNLDRAPSKMELCYTDKNARSIFMAKLEDMRANLQGALIKKDSNNHVKYINRPKTSVNDLTRAFLHDIGEAPCNCAKALPYIYEQLDIDWSKVKKDYDNRHQTKTYTLRKSRLIEDDDNLYRLFCHALDNTYNKRLAKSIKGAA